MTSTIRLMVPASFELPVFFATATPEEVARVLDIASRLPAWVNKHSDDMASIIEHNLVKPLESKNDEILSLKAKVAEHQRREEGFLTQQKDAEERMRSIMNAEYQEKMNTFSSTLQTSQTIVANMHTEVVEKEKKIQELSMQISSLQTPLGRGQSGEWDVASSLQGLGFIVEDTSHRGSEGYLDLLVYPEDSSNMRIAIEVKNRQDIKSQNLEGFEHTIQRGFKDNLYDGAIFVSIRTFVRKNKQQSVVMEMFDDDGGRPLVPVLWVGPEKGKHVTPMTQEQLESVVCMHMALLSQCHNLRRDLCQGVKDVDIERVRESFEVFGTELTDILQDINRQQKVVEDLKQTITSMRVRCIRMCGSLHETNKTIPWLGRTTINFPWMDTLLKAFEKKDTMKDAEIWNHLSGSKNVIEKSIGKDAMFMYFKNEKKRERDE